MQVSAWANEIYRLFSVGGGASVLCAIAITLSSIWHWLSISYPAALIVGGRMHRRPKERHRGHWWVMLLTKGLCSHYMDEWMDHNQVHQEGPDGSDVPIKLSIVFPFNAKSKLTARSII